MSDGDATIAGMLTVHRAERADTLVEVLAATMGSPLPDPMTAEVVTVDPHVAQFEDHHGHSYHTTPITDALIEQALRQPDAGAAAGPATGGEGAGEDGGVDLLGGFVQPAGS